MLAHLLGVAALVWVSFGLRFSPFADALAGRDRLAERWEALEQAGGGAVSVARFARDHRLLPEAYLWGLAYAGRHGGDRPAFLRGRFADGFVGFFPYAFLVKTPLGTLAVLLVAGLAVARQVVVGRAPPSVLAQLPPLVVLVVVYWAGAISTGLNIGHRHLLASYPALLVLAGGATLGLAEFWRWRRLLLPLLVLGSVAASWAVRPHYLAFFNLLAGGPRHGWRHLVDSSLDWGQDLPGLRDRLAREDAATRVYLSYFGTGSPDYYGLRVTRLPGWPEYEAREEQRLAPGLYCISATMLQPVYGRALGPWTPAYEQEYQSLRHGLGRDAADAVERRNAYYQYEWLRFRKLTDHLRRREPDEWIGYSILLYRLDEDELARALL
jgi:hypothetical protein